MPNHLPYSNSSQIHIETTPVDTMQITRWLTRIRDGYTKIEGRRPDLATCPPDMLERKIESLRDGLDDPEALEYTALRIRAHNLIQASMAIQAGLFTATVLDSGLVILQDGSVGKIRFGHGGAEFSETGGTRIYFTNNRTDTLFLNSIFNTDENKPNHVLVHNGQTYLICKSDGNTRSVVHADSKRHFQLMGESGGISLRERDVTQTALGRIFESDGQWYHVGQKRVDKCIPFIVNGETVFWVPSQHSLINGAGHITPLQSGQILTATDSGGQEVKLWHGKLLHMTEEPDLYIADKMSPANPLRHKLVTFSDGSQSFVLYNKDVDYIETGPDYFLVQEPRLPYPVVHVSNGFATDADLIQRAYREKWTFFRNNGATFRIDTHNLHNAPYGKTNFILDATTPNSSELQTHVALTLENSQVRFIRLFHHQWLKAIHKGHSFVVINGMIHHHESDTGYPPQSKFTSRFDFAIKFTRCRDIFSQDTFMPDLSSFSVDCGYYWDGKRYLKRIGRDGSDLADAPQINRAGVLVPAKTLVYEESNWAIHRSFQHRQREHFIVSPVDPNKHDLEKPPVLLLRKHSNGRLEQVFHGQMTFYDERRRHLRVIHVEKGFIWDVTHVEGIKILPYLGSNDRISPDLFKAFKEIQGHIEPATHQDLKDHLAGFLSSPVPETIPASLPPDPVDLIRPENHKLSSFNPDSPFVYAAGFMVEGNQYEVYTGFRATESLHTFSNGQSVNVVLPHPNDPISSPLMQRGVYLPKVYDSPSIYAWIASKVPASALANLKKLVIVPGISLLHSAAEYCLDDGTMTLFTQGSPRNFDQFTKSFNPSILVHELAGHGFQREPEARENLRWYLAAMILDGSTMKYGDTSLLEFDAVMAEYYYLYPELRHVFPNCFAVFEKIRGLMKTSKTKPQTEQIFFYPRPGLDASGC